MPISVWRLATALAARLDPVVPRPFSVRADGANVIVDHPAGWGFGSLIGDILEPDYDADDDWSEAERAGTIISAVLSGLQDAISEATSEPWPATPKTRDMAPYGTRHDDTAVYFWYGPMEEAPLIAFDPIRFRELVETE